MNPQTVRERLGHKFSNVEEVAAGVLRSVRRRGDKEVAVYVFDLNDRVAESAAHLDSYLDDVLGRSYFNENAPADLRWNHYLYLVAGQNSVGSDSFVAAKRKVEADKSYARKFVISEDELDSTLAQIDSVAVPQGPSTAGDVMQLWTTKLVESGLQSVLDVERAVADVVRIISSTTPKQSTRTRKTSGTDMSNLLVSSFLSSLDLSGFRQFPTRKLFDRLGKANLIVGANGVGKTSLLEGIEFLFCGANRRSDLGMHRKVAATLETGSDVGTSSTQKLSDFKTRQRLWYGSDDAARRNNLPNQFARFNFLNTDAAAELSLLGEGEVGVRGNLDSLADLLSGQEATLLWRRIEAVYRALLDEKKGNEADRSARQAERRAAEMEQKALAGAPKQSDAAFTVLSKDLARLGWLAPVSDKKSVSRQLVEQVSELASRLGIIRQLSWANKPVTPAWLDEQGMQLPAVVERLRKLLDASQTTQRRRTALSSRRREIAKRQTELEAISPEAASDLVRQAEDLERIERELTVSAKVMASILIDLPLDVDAELQKLIVASAKSTVATRLASAREQATSTQRKLTDLKNNQTRLQGLASHLRELARSAIEHGHSDQDCPVCGSHFEKGVLLQRIDSLVVGQAESESAAMARVLDGMRKSQNELAEAEALLDRLARFCEAAGVDATSTLVSDALLLAGRHQREHETRTTRRDVLRQTIESYRKNGLSTPRLRELCAHEDAPTAGVAHDCDVAAALTRTRSALQVVVQEMGQLDATIVAQALEAKEPLAAVGLSEDAGPAAGYERGLSRQKGVALAIDAREWASALVRFTPQIDIQACQAAAQSAVLTAESVVAAVEREAASGERLPKLKGQLERLDGVLARLNASMERLTKAVMVLKDLIENHSLENATKAAVLATHAVADEIFSRIHVPSEYCVTTDVGAPLARRSDGQPVSLREVSTGQRAAYALSIFLAMNAQVQAGPKVVILDDPISHVDDLNALSFLDYLRNLVVHSERQVLFATADEKTAGLFSHKFSFLGNEFRTIELTR